MLMERIAAGVGEKVAVAGAAILAATSFLPYWASIRFETTETSFSLLAGPTRLNVWDAYSTAVLVGVALSFVILILGLGRLVIGKPSLPPALLYAVGGAVITLLMLYGIWQGPQALFESLPLRGSVSGTFSFERGPLLYVGLVAAVTILIGGILAHRGTGRSKDAEI